MIDLWYFNTHSITQDDVKTLLQLIPKEMALDINRFHNHEDRRLKLFGKLIVRKYYQEKQAEFDWSKWRISHTGKPYYEGNKKFNISHSGNYVTVAFSDKEVGVDIEKLTKVDITSEFSYFHPNEIKHMESHSNSEAVFLKIWSRKEAYLKAIGKGIIDGLHNEDCLQNQLVDEETWYIHDFPLVPGYQLALCTLVPDCIFNTRELFLFDFDQ